MVGTQTKQRMQFRYRLKEPTRYNVILHNDDVTTMEFVVFILENIFHKEETEAEELMMKVHNEGSAIAGTYVKDIAESKKDKAINIARANNYPLMLSVEPEKI